jgi:hypothetical protein
MNLKDLMKADLDTVFFNADEFAREVVYTPAATGVPKPIMAIVDFGGEVPDTGSKFDDGTVILVCERDLRSDFGRVVARLMARVVVKVMDVPEPAYRDRVEIAGSVWRVARVFDHA